MSRINTNVSSLVAQNYLAKSNVDLQISLNRLSTGLRINSGKDDPSGLIASENLRSDITAVGKAITNTQQANQVIATADSALGQVSKLLNDIRGLITEAANTGVLSEEQIRANQLQVDSSLEAIDRIAQTTAFQGRKLLDGSLDFITSFSAGGATVRDLSIQQANLGTAGSLDVDVAISAAATKAEITTDGFETTAGVAATGGALTFTDQVPGTASTGNIVLTNTVATIALTASATGVAFDDVDVQINDVNTGNGATYTAGTNTITVDIDITGGDTVNDLVGLLNGLADFNATLSAGTGTDAVDAGDAGPYVDVTGGGVDDTTADDIITIEASGTGSQFNGTVSFTATNTVAAGQVSVSVTNGNIAILVNDNSNYNLNTLATTIGTALGGDYTVALDTNDSDGVYDSNADNAPGTANLAGGTNDTIAALADSLVVKIGGKTGSEVFNFGAGTTLDQVVDAINLVSDSTGVTAANNGGALELNSSDYGSEAFVDVEVISEGPSGTFEDGLSDTRSAGTDIAATVNGVTAKGSGNQLSINTSTLDLSLTVADGSNVGVSFSITGGGAVFQLGPDVVSNQQSRVGIGSIASGVLGGVNGRLFEVASGNGKDLSTDANGAAKIIDDVINKVTELRGRLGAFQRTTLDTNIASLNDTLVTLSDAESQIRDADFAAETAKLTRAQILVQSGTQVLQIANSNPQNVLSLLRG